MLSDIFVQSTNVTMLKAEDGNVLCFCRCFHPDAYKRVILESQLQVMCLCFYVPTEKSKYEVTKRNFCIKAIGRKAKCLNIFNFVWKF